MRDLSFIKSEQRADVVKELVNQKLAFSRINEHQLRKVCISLRSCDWKWEKISRLGHNYGKAARLDEKSEKVKESKWCKRYEQLVQSIKASVRHLTVTKR